MRHTIATMALIVLTLAAACKKSGPADTPPPFSALHPLDVAANERDIFRPGLVSAAQAALQGLPGASLYGIDLQISDDLLSLQGREKIWYTNREDEALDAIYLRLFPNIAGGAATISNVQVDGQALQPVYELESSAARLPLPAPLRRGERVEINLDFEVQVAQEMGGNYGLFGYFEGVLVLDEFYPVIPVYDDEGWNVELPPPNGDVTYFDASFYLLRVSAPAGLQVVASGLLLARQDRTWTFAVGPARDFYLAASEDFAVFSRRMGETTVNSYATHQRAGRAKLALDFATDALESFSQRFGPYPYTELDVVSTPMQASGIEYPGLVGISLDLYDPQVELYGLPSRVLLESTIAHKVAHQWFYNSVGNDQLDEPWLDEALAQYATWLYYLDVHGQSAAQDYRVAWTWNWGSVGRPEIPIGLPTSAYEKGQYAPIVYGRGPLFIEALAKEMGQQTFDEFLRAYCVSQQWGIATGESLRQLAEQHCQCDLSALFEEWVY